MAATFEIPFPPKPREPQGAHVEPPWVPVQPRWEYKELTRDLDTQGLPTEDELDRLGAEHWELVGVLRAGRSVHFYFKRERSR